MIQRAAYLATIADVLLFRHIRTSSMGQENLEKTFTPSFLTPRVDSFAEAGAVGSDAA